MTPINPTTPTKRPCTALRADGRPCRAWALRPTPGQPLPHPPLCAAHRHQAPAAPAPGVLDPLVIHESQPGAFYDDQLTGLELNIFHAASTQQTLDGEVRLVRATLRRLFAGFGAEHDMAGSDMAGSDMEKRALTLFKGAELVARLLQHQRDLAISEDPGRFPLEQALIEFSKELGLE